MERNGHLCVVFKIQPNSLGRYAAYTCFSTLGRFYFSLQKYQCDRKFLMYIINMVVVGGLFLKSKNTDSFMVSQLNHLLPSPSIKIHESHHEMTNKGYISTMDNVRRH